jgi:hypothetical protein
MAREDAGRPFEPARSPASRRGFPLGVLAAVALGSLILIACWRVPADGDSTPGGGSEAGKSVLAQLQKWGKPDLVLLLSAQQHGYLQPCGCSKPQYGGLTRRYNFLQQLQAGGWPVVAVDLGDIPPRNGLQSMLKYVTSMKALKLMGYTAVGIGEFEMGMPLINALGEYALNNPSPRVVCSNLRNRGKEQAFHGMVESWEVSAGKGQPRVGVVGAVGPSVMKRVKDPDVGFDAVPRVLPLALKEIQAKKPDFLVLLYQGSMAEAKLCARAIPFFHVIVCLSAEEEPPSVPEQVGHTFIVTLGHKGRYVGVVGAHRTGKKDRPFTLRYQLVSLGEEFDTPAGRAKNHPVMKLMEEYAREVKRRDFLAEAARQQVPHAVQLAFPRSTYVGSQKCKKCHEEAYDIWKASPHAHAYATLAKARHPSLRQYDSECISCHVTGWGYKGGFTSEARTALLRDNGCENCHGPGSEHARDPNNMKIRDLINPYRYDENETPAARTRRINLIDSACQKCHDIENDVKWQIDKWWDGKIVHSADRKKPK